jgi:hypothetical protein
MKRRRNLLDVSLQKHFSELKKIPAADLIRRELRLVPHHRALQQIPFILVVMRFGLLGAVRLSGQTLPQPEKRLRSG